MSGQTPTTPHSIVTGGAVKFTPMAAATLPFTGFQVIWVLVFALILFTAGCALAQLVPKKQK